MRVSCYVSIESLKEALNRIGYCQLEGTKPLLEWRRHEYHLTVNDKGKKGIVIQLHEDIPYSLPPFHRARHKSQTLEAEMNKILEAYRRVQSK